jgi:hypothetical protein
LGFTVRVRVVSPTTAVVEPLGAVAEVQAAKRRPSAHADAL